VSEQRIETIRVLVADDSEPLRHVLKAVLRMDPAIQLVGEASDYQQLLAIMSQVPADVIVMDVHMPDAEQMKPETVKLRLTDCCLLAISFANDRETANHAREFGAVRLLDKIELGRTLIPAIKNCRQEKTKSA
jgi:two-component system, chemotaxis family, protein-glutamate methylesterase/glutaminase